MHAKRNRDTVPQVINGRINGRFALGHSGNPGGSPDAVRRVVNKAFLQDMAIAWRKHGAKALDRVAKDHPAAFCKLFTLLVPRQHTIENSNAIKNLTDEELEAMIEYLKTSLEAQAGGPVQVIEGMIEPSTVPATALPVLEPPKRKPGLRTGKTSSHVGLCGTAGR
jgi:hypothetical protein